MNWGHAALWTKSKLFLDRALEAGPGSTLYAFWMSLALELLAKAALSKIHPVLLADPRDGSNILYACGIASDGNPTRSPRSIPAHTLYERCRLAFKNFTKDDEAFCLGISGRRNSELHSAESGFDNYETAEWLANYYRAVTALLKTLGKTLDEFLGSASEAKAARKMIKADDAVRRVKVAEQIKAAKSAYKRLTAATKAKREKTWGAALTVLNAKPNGHVDTCPACGHDCWVEGSKISSSAPKFDGDEIVIRSTYLPDRLLCKVCNLSFRSHSDLHIAGCGGQFTGEEMFDAVEYYAGQYEPDFDYGND
jgi:hypothetical protein